MEAVDRRRPPSPGESQDTKKSVSVIVGEVRAVLSSK